MSNHPGVVGLLLTACLCMHGCVLQVEEVLSLARIRPTVNELERHPMLQQQKFVNWNLDNVSEACVPSCLFAKLFPWDQIDS